jgi:hypothetical protein
MLYPNLTVPRVLFCLKLARIPLKLYAFFKPSHSLFAHAAEFVLAIVVAWLEARQKD